MKMEMTWLVLAVSYLFLFHGLCLVFLVFFFKTRDFFSFFFLFLVSIPTKKMEVAEASALSYHPQECIAPQIKINFHGTSFRQAGSLQHPTFQCVLVWRCLPPSVHQCCAFS